MHNKRLLSRSLVVAAVLCLTTVALVYVHDAIKSYSLHKKQQKLAEMLGVDIRDFPHLPGQYFYSVVKPGMPLEEVHTVVVGYEKVYNDRISEEIYYYFSTEDDKAVRFAILYDKDYRVQKFYEEDANSRIFTIEGWSVGPLSR